MAIAVYAIDGARATSTVPAWSPEMYISNHLSERQQGLDIQGEIPMLLEGFVPFYSIINDEIFAAKDNLIERTRRVRARSINFEYEIFYTNEVVSIVIMATTRAVTDRTTVTSVNFNLRTGAILTLTQAMGMDITPLAEGIIADMIRQNPAIYYAAFNAVPTGQAFYLTDHVLVLLFDEFQLSSAPGSTRSIEFVLDNIKLFTIARSEYRISQDQYEIKMMPLRQILNNMGYVYEDVVWNPSGNPLDQEVVIRRNGRAKITLRIGENNFQINGVMQRSLEAAPDLIDGATYVPISFFDQILGLTAYSIDEQGNITFMAYIR